MATEVRNQDGWRKLARDVGVNLVANLLAAAVVYLGAVAGGYVTSNDTLMNVALWFVFTAAALLGTWAVWELADRFGWWAGVPAAVILIIIFCALSTGDLFVMR